MLCVGKFRFKSKDLDYQTLCMAMALVLVIEGLFPFISPKAWREAFTRILQMQDGQIRFFAMLSILVGLILISLLS
jgi:uncharacterized protein